MAWVKIPQDIWCHPRFTTLPADVVLAWVKAWAYSSQHGTDGRVLAGYLAGIHPAAPADTWQRLAAAGLVREEDGVVELVDFLKLNLSAAQRAGVTEAQRAKANKRWSDAPGMPPASVRHANGIPSACPVDAVAVPSAPKPRSRVAKAKPAQIQEYRPHLDAMSDEALAKLTPAQLVAEYFRFLWHAKYQQDPTYQTKHWVGLDALLLLHPAQVLIKAVHLAFYAGAPLPWPLNEGPVTIDRFLKNFDLLVGVDAQAAGGAAVRQRIEADARLNRATACVKARLAALEQPSLPKEQP